MIKINPIPESGVEKLLEDKAVMVTVNQHLARYLTSRFNKQQIDAGKSVWETPDILPYSAWLGRLYANARYLPDKELSGNLKIPLSAAQEQYVWQKVIQSSTSGNSLLRVPETVKAAIEAWTICKERRLPLHELTHAPPEDTLVFLEWAEAFENQCRRNGWLGTASRAEAVVQLLKSGTMPAPGQMILAGFDELSPQQVLLVKALEDAGCRIFELAVSEVSSQALRCGLADTETEMKAAARWARARLEENPLGRIGIVVRDLNALRSDLVRIFDDVFHPSMVLSPQIAGKRAYNISLGRPLDDYPLIRTALMILKFACRDLSVDEYSRLLRSPFIGGADAEFSKRAIMDARIRENGETSLSVSDMMHFSSEHQDKDRHPGVFCPKLSERLEKFKKAIGEIPKKQLPSGWVRDFLNLLDAMGWPNGRKLNSEEFQTVIAWHEVLQAVSSYDPISGEMDIHEAISLLSQNVTAKNFQPETEDAPVQVLGVLEAAGEGFDHLWIMGLDAENWPPSAKPNPLLPGGVQKKYNVPHASPERELAYAREVTRRLLASAGHTVVSYPLTDKDTALFPSPLISFLEQVTIHPGEANWRARVVNAADFEKIIDQHGPAAGAKSHISGGTGLLKAQATCPFSAFAAYRLKAEGLEVPESGLNARERGSLVHNALELFWEQVKTLDALKKLPDEELSGTVSHAVNRAVSAMAKNHPRTFTRRFTELEKERLKFLVLEFLAVDSQRTSFTVIGREEKLVCTIADIELNTVVDRIDCLNDGRRVIVDYKTGEPKVADWFTDRIAEPQLPLYSVAVEKEVAGVVFARLKKGHVAYLGVAEAAQVIPGAAGPGDKKSPMENYSSLKDVIRVWKGKIEFLADEVRQGIAKVAPVSVHKSCLYCDFGPMCRIGEWKSTLNIEHPTVNLEEGNGLF
ncbi:MAG: DNA repair protein [Desulfobacterales bacterium CG23_combo_of_CG06-09_8_20_14_all_51_8]|nr:MAG: DNA repair protein [Desulfobacterales bacterium CG23_combo_of_CG06-09_8_20_14_all_51_8]